MIRFALSLLFLASISASASALSLSDPRCQQATSLAACQAHLDYASAIVPTPDTSAPYIKNIDPRYNLAMRTAGGPGGAGGF